jgi:hypothetical protein
MLERIITAWIKKDGWCRTGLEECGPGAMENKSLGKKNSMGSCPKNSKGRMYMAVVLKK